jgi:hypothetical protein
MTPANDPGHRTPARRWPDGLPSPAGIAALTLIATACGGLAQGGLRGLQAGLAAGVTLSFAPCAMKKVWNVLRRRDGLPRFLLRQAGDAVIAAAARLVDVIARRTAPIGAALRGPFLLALLAVDILAGTLGGWLGAVARPFLRLPGIANLAALAIVAANVAGLPAATIALFAGLPALVLVLLVSASEQPARARPDPR